MKEKLLNIKLTPVKIAEIFVFLLIPLVYCFLIGGFKDIPDDIKNNKPYDPLGVIKTDFVNEILSGKLDSLIMSFPAEKSLTDTGRLYRIVNSQRVVIGLPNVSEIDTENFYFNSVNGYKERTDNGKNVIYLSAGNYVDNKQKLEKCFAVKNITGQTPLKLDHDTTSSVEWYFKPCMKIRIGDFNPVDSRPVAALIIYDQGGNIIDSTVIRIRSFSDLNGKYDGGFTEKYHTEFEMPGHNLSVSTVKLFGNNKYERFQVGIYWYGEVDLWFEKLTIDDYMANYLFQGNYINIIKDGNGLAELLSVSNMLKQKMLKPANYTAVNYVMNVLYDNLQNKTDLP